MPQNESDEQGKFYRRGQSSDLKGLLAGTTMLFEGTASRALGKETTMQHGGSKNVCSTPLHRKKKLWIYKLTTRFVESCMYNVQVKKVKRKQTTDNRQCVIVAVMTDSLRLNISKPKARHCPSFVPYSHLIPKSKGRLPAADNAIIQVASILLEFSWATLRGAIKPVSQMVINKPT